VNPFYFYTKLDQTILLGVTTPTIPGLLEGIRRVPEASIYYHTHRYLQQHHYLSPEPPNDFAYWVNQILNDAELGEQLSSIDIIRLDTIQSIRLEFIDMLRAYIASSEKLRESPPGQEFHFMSCQTFAMQTPHTANSIPEFLEQLRHVSISSIYYHVFDAKLRLGHGENDFSRWFRDRGKIQLADAVARLDPYTYTLEGLRTKIIALAEKHGSD